MLRPKKSLGQNFLVDPNTVRKIVDALDAPDGAAVVEIGPGTGAMTSLLRERYEPFVAIELDQRAVELLQAEQPGLDVRQADVLEVDWKALAHEHGGALYVIGNLPYYITSQILFSLIEARTVVREAVLMMQLEVAERLVAAPRTKAYGILSVVTQLYARPELLFRVSRNVFVPRPDVTSAVVRLTMNESDPHPSLRDAFVRRVVRMAFNQRRKTLRNSLRRLTDEMEIDVPEEWAGRRAEELTPADFVALSHSLGADKRT